MFPHRKHHGPHYLLVSPAEAGHITELGLGFGGGQADEPCISPDKQAALKLGAMILSVGEHIVVVQSY
jgi:hypothetical protein